MTPSQHFLLGFALSIFAGVMLALGVLFMQDWISERGIYPPVAMLTAFLFGKWLMRWVFCTFVKVDCVFGCGRKAYALKGRADRFRCEQCGNDM